MKQFIEQLFAENGATSAMRFVFVLCSIAMSFTPAFVWAFISIASGQLAEFPATVTGFFSPILMFLLAGKLIQKGQETASVTP
jgi:hypothetical protein